MKRRWKRWDAPSVEFAEPKPERVLAIIATHACGDVSICSVHVSVYLSIDAVSQAWE